MRECEENSRCCTQEEPLSSLSLCLLITTMFVINFGLECFTNLGLAYIHHSAHILFVYKLVLIIL